MAKQKNRRGRRSDNNQSSPKQELPLTLTAVAAVGHPDVDRNTENRGLPQRLSRLEKAEKWSVVIAAVVGLASIWFLIESLRLSRFAIEVAERAWIVSSSVAVHMPDAPGKSINGSLGIRNVGNSPARRLHLSVHSMLTTDAEIDQFVLPEQWSPGDEIRVGQRLQVMDSESTAVLGKDQEFTSEIQSPLVTAAQFTEIQSSTGKTVLLMLGRASYEDVFGIPHVTYVCRRWSAREPTGKAGVCKRWNDAD